MFYWVQSVNSRPEVIKYSLCIQIVLQGPGRRGKFWIEGRKIKSKEILWRQSHCRISASDGNLTGWKDPIELGPDDKLCFMFTKDQSSLLVPIAFLSKDNF